MSKTTAFSAALLNLLFLNRNAELIGDVTGLRGSLKLGRFWLSLHVQDPGFAGAQTSHECRYSGYRRIPADRGPDVWKVVGRKAIPQVSLDFPEVTGGDLGIVRYIGLGTAETGGGLLLYRAKADPDVALAVGMIPRIRKDSTEFGED